MRQEQREEATRPRSGKAGKETASCPVVSGNTFTGNRVNAIRVDSGSLPATTITWPAATAGSLYYLLGCADDTNAVNEGTAGETNNCRAAAGQVTITK